MSGTNFQMQICFGQNTIGWNSNMWSNQAFLEGLHVWWLCLHNDHSCPAYLNGTFEADLAAC